MKNGIHSELTGDMSKLSVTSKNIATRDKINDPTFRTARTKLQFQRTDVNAKINKELRMRFGAENLLQVVRDKKAKEKVATELDYVNSNLQLLKDELEQVNCSLDAYQKGDNTIAMVPLGIKETESVSFTTGFRDFLLEHYSEDPDTFANAIDKINQMREKTRTPKRSEDGLADYIRYFNLLNTIDKRLFPPDRSIGVYFTWFDSFTGYPYQQRTVVFEKGCILFNVAALYSQIATAEDRTSMAGLERCMAYFSLAAGAIKHLRDNFDNPPGVDMKSEVLAVIYDLFMTQAQECAYLQLVHKECRTQFHPVNLAGEAFWVGECFERTYTSLSEPGFQYSKEMPYTWANLLQSKAGLYKGIAYHTVASHLLSLSKKQTPAAKDQIKETMERLQGMVKRPIFIHQSPPTSREEVDQFAKSLLQEALSNVEEAIRTATFSKHLRTYENFMKSLRDLHKSWLSTLHSVSTSDKLENTFTPPELVGVTQHSTSPRPLDTALYPVEDPFHILGPLGVFCAKRNWTTPRSVTIVRDQRKGYGFSIKGGRPVSIIEVLQDSPADRVGMREGDLVIAIVNGDREVDTKWLGHEQVVPLIREAGGGLLTLRLVTPLYQNPDLNASANGGMYGYCPSAVTTPAGSISMRPPINGSKLSTPYGTVTSTSSKISKWRRRLSGSWFKKNRNNSWGRSSSISDLQK